MEKNMKFYKITLQAGHVGRGKSQPLTVYSFGNSMLNRIDITKNLPMVKRQRGMPITYSCEITEYEYVVGIVQNPYYNKFNNDESEIAKLPYVNTMISHIQEYKFKTDEGKQLEEYCHQYAEANKTDKLKVERNYKRWAKQLVDKYDQEKYNLLIF